MQRFAIHDRLISKQNNTVMKKHIKILSFALLGLTLAFSSCKKEEVQDNNDSQINLAVDETVDALTDSLEIFMIDPFVSEATETEDVLIESIPEILDADYFAFVETRSSNPSSYRRTSSLLS